MLLSRALCVDLVESKKKAGLEAKAKIYSNPVFGDVGSHSPGFSRLASKRGETCAQSSLFPHRHSDTLDTASPNSRKRALAEV